MIDSARFNVTPNTLWVILGTSFYGSNDPNCWLGHLVFMGQMTHDPTNSVKALKEDWLGFNPIRSIPPCSQ